MKHFKNSIIIFLLLSILFACNSNNEAEKKSSTSKIVETKKTDSPKVVEPDDHQVSVKENIYANQVALYMAGISQPSTNELKNLEQIPRWQTYSKKFDTLWTKLENSRLGKERKWASHETVEANQATKFLFYPFSGADFMHGYTFFPDARKMVLIGLEPPGSLPNLEKLKLDSGKKYFASIQKSLFSILQWSFFQTKSMAKDFKTEEIDGTLPLIMIFMARTGNTIINAEPVYVDSNGVETIKTFPVNIKYKHKGVRVTYKSSNSDKIKELYYYQADIANGGLAENKGFYKLLQSFNFQSTYLKSASYLMHNDYFSTIRNLILQKSLYVLQDDSGIPFRFFNNKNWKHILYGTYDKPIKLFENRFQSDFKEAYHKDSTNVRPLTFGIGYDWQENTSNLMLAIKQK